MGDLALPKLVPFRENFFLVALDLGQPGPAEGDVLTLAKLVPDGSQRQGFEFFEQRKAGGKIARLLGFAQEVGRFEQGCEEAFLGVARADDPCGDTIDAGVEIIEADVGAFEKIAAD